MEHFDVVIVGAGLSGIGAARHLQRLCPDRSFVVLEGRAGIGGTWDLFRYPGVRSDSDMHTLGYAFKPWRGERAIADGPAILDYISEAARETGVDRHIRFGQRVRRAAWSSKTATWTVETDDSMFSCGFLYTCTGYYDYAEGYLPEFAGVDDFRGRLVHPQQWPQGLDTTAKRVVVIGSGATAVTLVPELARTAAHVTMLQRSPTYIVSRPAEDAVGNALRRRLPAGLAYRLTRWKNVLLGMIFYNLARKRPAKVRDKLLALVRAQLGPDYDVATHFTPSYDPWDQRLCLVPDADLFEAIKAGRASVVTDRIARFVAGGIELESGGVVEADIVVAATGLKLQLLGGMDVSIDGARCDLSERLSYKGLMFSDVPNLASTFGYTNASWTLKADLTATYICRLLNHMRRSGAAVCMPQRGSDPVEARPALAFSSGYVQRGIAQFPKQGDTAPWRLNQNYAVDMVALRFGRLDDGVMRFAKASDRSGSAAA